MTETLTAEQIEALMQQGEDTAPEGSEELGVLSEEYESDSPHGVVTPIASPITVHLKNGTVFVSSKPYASAYTNIGLYVKGVIKGTKTEDDGYYVIPYSSISFTEFDMTDLDNRIEQAKQDMAEQLKALAEDEKDDGDDS